MILVIGSTGNIGKYVVQYLEEKKTPFKEGIYNCDDSTETNVRFDFLDKTTFKEALTGIDSVFFIRPPQLGNPKDMYPFLDYCKEVELKHIVFVSLMGIEKNPIPPHAKIEKYIKNIGLNYTFIRPSFFMENLIYPHGDDIKNYNEIIIPALKAKTSFIACKDIGEVCAEVLINSSDHESKAYTITGKEALDYYEVAAILSDVLNRNIVYLNPSMRKYMNHMKNKGLDIKYVKVTRLLYFMTRLGTAKKTTGIVKEILNREPTTLRDFIIENKNIWIG